MIKDSCGEWGRGDFERILYMERIVLIGAEDVYRAGCTMQSAAQDMKQAAINFESSLEINRRFLDDWLQRLEDVLKAKETV